MFTATTTDTHRTKAQMKVLVSLVEEPIDCFRGQSRRDGQQRQLVIKLIKTTAAGER
jgi:hypothetical protein